MYTYVHVLSRVYCFTALPDLALRDFLTQARAWRKWREHCTSCAPQLKHCAARMIAAMLKTSLDHRLRKCWARWRDEAQERRVSARMDAIASEYQTSLHQMRRTKSDLQDAMQQYQTDVRTKELKLSKEIGAKRVFAIGRSQLNRRIRVAFERWRLISKYSTEATQLKNDKYKLEVKHAHSTLNGKRKTSLFL